MLPPDTAGPVAAADDRQVLRRLIAELVPSDDREAADRNDVLAWIDSGEELYRRLPPDTPPKHLVTYFLPYDERTDRVFLVDHRKARRRLPPGGHVEPGEHPWATVVREAGEELQAAVWPHPWWAGEQPLFVTVAQTVGPHVHTDCTLWFPIALDLEQPLTPDPGEFAGWGWYSRTKATAWPAERTDPHLSRFLTKLSRHTAAGERGADSGPNADTTGWY